ncbi:hypothetical protein WA026_021631 [Henosepilachna vigintioctopunctata]|uniref:Reverse transcriptase zinc-binding domain-containing protein n=1 Tax=Henosepilachna vigintioctopunctata TaxID=420089 RepID=A0AAW1V1U6_9CUCU
MELLVELDEDPWGQEYQIATRPLKSAKTVYNISQINRNKCKTCDEIDDPEHMFYSCLRWTRQRRMMEGEIGNLPLVEELIPLLTNWSLQKPENDNTKMIDVQKRGVGLMIRNCKFCFRSGLR